MNCSRCNTQNDDSATSCKSCGTALSYTPLSGYSNSNQTVNQLLLLMGIEYSINVGWFVFQKAIVPVLFKTDGVVDWENVSSIYKYLGLATDILSILVLFVFVMIIKHKNARLILIIFFILKIIFLFGYRVFDSTY